MPFAASLHGDDALTGLIIGAAAALVVLAWAHIWATRAQNRAPHDTSAHRFGGREVIRGVATAVAAGAVAMVVAVGRDLVADLSFAPAVASLAVASLAGAGWAWFAHHRAVPVTAALAIVTVAGMWLAVPDTEATIALAMAWLPFVILANLAEGRPATVGNRLVGAVPWLAAAAVAAVAAAWGSATRDRVLPGALACFGVALVVPWVSAVSGRALRPTVLVALHVIAVVAAARWAARAPSVEGGLVRSAIVLVTLTAIAAAATVTARARGHPPRSARPGRRR